MTITTQRYWEAPNEYNLEGWISIFLAGGISNCPDWQKELGSELILATDLAVVNPRRYDFDMSNKDQEDTIQIPWEWHAMEDCDFISFWFPKETLCPITLFEFGKWLADQDKHIFVGAHPEYARRNDLLIQMELERPGELILVDSVEALGKQIIDYRRATSHLDGNPYGDFS